MVAFKMKRNINNLILRLLFLPISAIFLFNISAFCQSPSTDNSGINTDNESNTKAAHELKNLSGDDEIAKAYRTLVKNGIYEDKKKALKSFSDNYTNDRVIDIIDNLLEYFYTNPDFKEDDQVMYYDDVIAEGLVRILLKNGSSKSFPVLLNIVLDNRHHRDQTVKAAWETIEAIHW